MELLNYLRSEEEMDRKIADQEWPANSAPPASSSPIRMPATPPSATILGAGSQTTSSSPYNRSGQYPSPHQQQQQQQQPHPMSPPHNQRNLPPIPIQPYTTPPSRQTPSLPPIHSHPHHLTTPQYHAPPPNAPPTPGETPWDLRQTEVYRLDDHTCRLKLMEAIQYIQHLSSTLASTRTSLAQYTLQNTLLRNESREISQRSAVETELAKREVEVLLREYAAQMPSANQLANTYYRRYRGLKRRVKDLETIIEDRESELKRMKEYVRDNGMAMPREGAKRTRRTGLKYAPRGGAWAVAGKNKPPVVPRTLKPAPSSQLKSEANSQESQASSGLDALGMLASQFLDSQESQKQQHSPSQPTYLPSTLITSTPYNIPSSPVGTRISQSSQQKQTSLLSPLPIPVSKRRRNGSQASDSTIEPDPALTESEVSPTKIRVLDDSDEEDDEDDERIVRESPLPPSQPNPYASSLPIPYRTTRSVARDLIPGGPRRKLNFDSKDSELLNHD